MASPGELIDAIATATGVPRARIFSAHRYLREAGFISQGGRGTSAAKMTARDAAHILIATASAKEVKDSPSLIERPGSLVSTAGKWKLDFLSFPPLEALPADHSFSDAIEALIIAAADGTLQMAAEAVEGGPVDLARDLAPVMNVRVAVLGPTPRGAILIEELLIDTEGNSWPHPDRHYERHFYGNRSVPPGGGNLAWMDVARPGEMDADLTTEMTFSHRTLAIVGGILSSDS